MITLKMKPVIWPARPKINFWDQLPEWSKESVVKTLSKVSLRYLILMSNEQFVHGISWKTNISKPLISDSNFEFWSSERAIHNGKMMNSNLIWHLDIMMKCTWESYREFLVEESARVKRSRKPSHYIISHCFSNETMPNYNSMENFMEYYFIAQSQNYHLTNIFRK